MGVVEEGFVGAVFRYEFRALMDSEVAAYRGYQSAKDGYPGYMDARSGLDVRLRAWERILARLDEWCREGRRLFLLYPVGDVAVPAPCLIVDDLANIVNGVVDEAAGTVSVEGSDALSYVSFNDDEAKVHVFVDGARVVLRSWHPERAGVSFAGMNMFVGDMLVDNGLFEDCYFEQAAGGCLSGLFPGVLMLRNVAVTVSARVVSGLALAQDTLVEADFETCCNFNFERIHVSRPTKILADDSVGDSVITIADTCGDQFFTRRMTKRRHIKNLLKKPIGTFCGRPCEHIDGCKCLLFLSLLGNISGVEPKLSRLWAEWYAAKHSRGERTLVTGSIQNPMAAISLRMGMKLMVQFIVDNTPKRSKGGE